VKKPIIIPVEQMSQEPYASVLCFPNLTESELKNRVAELRSHGVTALEFSGTASVFGVAVPVLGKGFVGIVVIAHLNGERVAVKIRRTDADRADLLHEGNMLSKANSAGVAPKLIAASKNFLLMQLINGELLPNWLKTNKDKVLVKLVLGEILEQCYRLDQIGLDHGELSKAPKHLIVDEAEKTFILDFETASLERRAANVTAVCQYLFGGNSPAAKTLDEIFGERNRLELIDVLKTYKKNKTRENFEGLLEFCFAN
jgi:putative serine/threonine protein kinase